MLDSTSLEVISRFKQALLNKQTETEKPTIEGTETLPIYNRGLKLSSSSASSSSLLGAAKLVPSIVPNNSYEPLKTKNAEYNGKKYTVLTNESIENDNSRNKRKWNQRFGDKKQIQESEELEWGTDTIDYESENEDGDGDGDNDIIHPLKKSRIIELLSPLNHPSEIISHPAISKTYKLQILSKLSMELIELIEIEQNNLNWLNKLLQVLNGEDWFYLLEENLGLKEYDHGLDEEKKKKIEEKKLKQEQVQEQEQEQEQEKEKEQSKEQVDGEVPQVLEVTVVEEIEQQEEENNKPSSLKDDEFEDEEENSADPFFALPTALKRYETYQQSLESNDPLKEDLINYLQVSIQRQHEYIKNLTLLRNGLVRADRLKKDLYKWGKEMYDKKSS